VVDVDVARRCVELFDLVRDRTKHPSVVLDFEWIPSPDYITGRDDYYRIHIYGVDWSLVHYTYEAVFIDFPEKGIESVEHTLREMFRKIKGNASVYVFHKVRDGLREIGTFKDEDKFIHDTVAYIQNMIR